MDAKLQFRGVYVYPLSVSVVLIDTHLSVFRVLILKVLLHIILQQTAAAMKTTPFLVLRTSVERGLMMRHRIF